MYSETVAGAQVNYNEQGHIVSIILVGYPNPLSITGDPFGVSFGADGFLMEVGQTPESLVTQVKALFGIS